MQKTIVYFTFLSLIFIYSCASNPLKKSYFLEGTWKMENKEQFEVWEKNAEGKLSGYSYKIANDQEVRMETLSIQKSEGQVVYEALVPNQNNGQAIPFTLNTAIQDLLSFENLNHDFPKKIQYQKLSDTEILVKVLGDGDKGFSYKIIKQ